MRFCPRSLMSCRRTMPGWLGLVALLAGLPPAGAAGQGPAETVAVAGWLRRPGAAPASPSVLPPFDPDEVPEDYRAGVLAVLEKPTFRACGPAEAFHCQAAVYRWLLDHPDRAVWMWRKLGAVCTDITDRGGGRFGWRDGHGSDVHWDTVVR